MVFWTRCWRAGVCRYRSRDRGAARIELGLMREATLVSPKLSAWKISSGAVSQDGQVSSKDEGKSSFSASAAGRKTWHGIHRRGEAGASAAPGLPQAAPGATQNIQPAPFAGELGQNRSQDLAESPAKSDGYLPAAEESLRTSIASVASLQASVRQADRNFSVSNFSIPAGTAASAADPGGFATGLRAKVSGPRIAAGKIPATLNVSLGAALPAQAGRDLPQFAALSIPNSPAASVPIASHRNDRDLRRLQAITTLGQCSQWH